jgi:hypothetical protein
MAPAIISPIRCGILNLFRMIGAKRIINRISEKSNTGLVRGKVSSNRFSSIIGGMNELNTFLSLKTKHWNK